MQNTLCLPRISWCFMFLSLSLALKWYLWGNDNTLWGTRKVHSGSISRECGVRDNRRWNTWLTIWTYSFILDGIASQYMARCIDPNTTNARRKRESNNFWNIFHFSGPSHSELFLQVLWHLKVEWRGQQSWEGIFGDNLSCLRATCKRRSRPSIRISLFGKPSRTPWNFPK